jgi:hypothetical protein
MTLARTFHVPFPPPLHRLYLLVVATVLMATLLAMLPPAVLQPALPVQPPAQPMPIAPPATSADLLARGLPLHLAGQPELVEQRTASSATFELNPGTYTTFLAPEPIHFWEEDTQAWQVIDPRFRTLPDSYAVEYSGLGSRAGLRSPWLTTSVGSSGMLAWQSHELGLSLSGGNYLPLAQALPEAPTFAEQADEGHTLRYHNAWSDPTLVEEFLSGPYRIKQQLVLNSLPAVGTGSPAHLELRATIRLPLGGTLWADGKEQSAAFQSAGPLEIHSSDGAILVIDAPLALELAGEAQVAGHYRATPGAQSGEWTLSVLTPWAWWADPARRFPAAIDPTMRINTPTGIGDGMAWVGQGYDDANPYDIPGLVDVPANPDTKNENFRTGGMRLGSWFKTQPYRGYVQFNAMPAMLSSPLTSVTKAELSITPKKLLMPFYEYQNLDGGIDWDEQSFVPFVQLSSLGACPAECNGFSLAGSSLPPGLSWANSPVGTLVSNTQPFSLPPNSAEYQPAVWDVTSTINSWYEAQPPHPTDGPAFMLQLTPPPFNIPGNLATYLDGTCQNFSFLQENSLDIRNCRRITVEPKDVRLSVTYNVPPLALGETIQHGYGVPSYLDGVLENTGHLYDLANPVAKKWYAVAARGNHAVNSDVPARVNLVVGNYASDEESFSVSANGTTAAVDDTAYVLVDTNTCGDGADICDGDLHAEVRASNTNNYPEDHERNYTVEYVESVPATLNYGAWYNQVFTMRSDKLIRLLQFSLNEGDNVTVKLTSLDGPAQTIHALVPPSSGASAKAVRSNDQLNTAALAINSPQKTAEQSLAVPTGGTWALSIVNQGRPSLDTSVNPPRLVELRTRVEILRCPAGNLATAKWGCQPLFLPPFTGLNPAPEVKIAAGVTVFSPGGFIPNDRNGVTWCTTDEGDGAPVFENPENNGWTFVGQGRVCFDGTKLTTSADSGVGIAYKIVNSPPPGPPRGQPIGPLVYGGMGSSPVAAGELTGVTSSTVIGSETHFIPEATTRRNVRPYDQNWGTVLAHQSDSLHIRKASAIGSEQIDAQVSVETTAPPFPVRWKIDWQYYADGVGERYFFIPTVQQNAPFAANAPVDLASMDLRVLDGALLEINDYIRDPGGPIGGQFRAMEARITQRAEMGGASKNVQAVIQPPGKARLPLNEQSCFTNGDQITSCLDLREPSYSWTDDGSADNAVEAWALPDIHITEQAGLLALSSAGQTTVFSNDHPLAEEGKEDEFSFDTFSVEVSVAQELCLPEDTEKTLVVRGEGKIGVPSVGDGVGSPAIAVAFKLCNTSLREAALTFTLPEPGLIVGSTGLGVTLIGGKVVIAPDYTTITININFNSTDASPGTPATIKNGKGQIIIDTRGAFDATVSALIVGVFDASVHLFVSWAPLDILVEAKVSAYDELISGALKLHAWVGQGWQNKYNWLPDNDEFHFTGFIKASLKIPENYMGDFIPPTDVVIEAKIAFGQFCSNEDCSVYQWGASVTVSVAGFDTGLYFDADGVDIIFGSNDHVLIDEFGGAQQQQQATLNALVDPDPTLLLPGQLQPFLAPKVNTPFDEWQDDIISPADGGCQGSGSTLSCPFTVEPGTGRAVFMARWLNGDLDITLTDPSGTQITPATLPAGSSYTETVGVEQQALFNIKPSSPVATVTPGVWKLNVSKIGQGLPQGLKNNYTLFFFTDPAPPLLNWQAPLNIGQSPAANGLFNLGWTVARGGQPLAADDKPDIELVYTPVLTTPLALDEFAGIPIVGRLAATANGYAWDTRGLASGEYRIGARIDDHRKGNGHLVSWAPGTVIINDTTPPPAPTFVGNEFVEDEGLVVTWERLSPDQAPDLAGYLVEYTFPNWDNSSLPMVRNVLPRGKTPTIADGAVVFNPEHVQARLGGLLSGFTTEVCVRAYDASGNIGPCENIVIKLPPRPITTPKGPPQRVALSSTAAPALRVNWAPPANWTPAGYMLAYTPVGCLVPGASKVATQGPSPLKPGNVLATELTGLTPGQRYTVAVSGYANNGFVGPARTDTALFAPKGDGNGDGVPDDWMEAYSLTNPDADPDSDKLTNREEYQAGSNPRSADSDNDQIYDGDEQSAGSSPCSWTPPPAKPKARLQLKGKLVYNFVQAINDISGETQELLVLNGGLEQLDWQASTDAAWIKLGQTEGEGNGAIPIRIDTGGLAPGLYEGAIIIIGKAGGSGLAQASPIEQTEVRVRVRVLPAAEQELYIPLVRR